MSGLSLMKMKLKNYKKHSFSLFEIVVGLAILLMITSFVGVKGYDLIKSYRFENALQRIREELALTHQVATSYQIDIDFTLEDCKGGIQCIRSTDERLKHLVPFFKKKMTFKGVRITDVKRLPLTIHFYGSGWVDPQKAFTLSNNERNASIEIIHALSPLITTG